MSPSMAAIPNVGGRQTGTGQQFGGVKILTPKQLHAKLDEYVVGQHHAKKVGAFFLEAFFITGPN